MSFDLKRVTTSRSHGDLLSEFKHCQVIKCGCDASDLFT